MSHRPARRIALCLSLLLATPAFAQFSDFGDSRDVVRVTVYPARNAVEPGGNLRIAIIIDHQPKWHTHTNDPIVPPELGDPADYINTAINVQTPAGSPLLAHPELIKWPQTHMTMVNFLSEPVEYGVFSERAIAYLPVVVRRDAKPGVASLTVKATYQACDDKVCLAPVRDQSFPITISIVAPGQAPPEAGIDQAIFAFARPVSNARPSAPVRPPPRCMPSTSRASPRCDPATSYSSICTRRASAAAAARIWRSRCWPRSSAMPRGSTAC